MKIGVFGTGMAGRALAGRFAELGHDVLIGTRDPAATMARTEPEMTGTAPFSAWAADHSAIRLVTFAEAAAVAELVVNATGGGSSVAALGMADPADLDGKVLLDVANPLDFSGGLPPTLFVKDTDSLAEQIQRAFPGARIVKSLNTLNADLMIEPGRIGAGDSTVFVSGDDPEAKAVVRALLGELGWRDVIDLGGLATARGAEMVLPLWLSLMGTLGTPFFNFKIVR